MQLNAGRQAQVMASCWLTRQEASREEVLAQRTAHLTHSAALQHLRRSERHGASLETAASSACMQPCTPLALLTALVRGPSWPSPSAPSVAFTAGSAPSHSLASAAMAGANDRRAAQPSGRVTSASMPLAQLKEGSMLNNASPPSSVPLGWCRKDMWPGVWPGVAIQLHAAWARQHAAGSQAAGCASPWRHQQQRCQRVAAESAGEHSRGLPEAAYAVLPQAAALGAVQERDT